MGWGEDPRAGSGFVGRDVPAGSSTGSMAVTSRGIGSSSLVMRKVRKKGTVARIAATMMRLRSFIQKL
jgi:hypothetical protein